LARYGVGENAKSDQPGARAAEGMMPLLPRQPPYYSLVDYDGCRDFAPPDTQFQKSDRFFLAGEKDKSLGYDRFPRYWRSKLTNGESGASATGGHPESLGYPRGDPPWYPDRINEFRYHPMAFSPFMPAPGNPTFGLWNMDALLRHGDTGADAMVSDLRRLLPGSWSNPKVRQLVTLHSCDVDAPGVMPWNDGHSKFLKLASSYPLVLVGGATPFPEQ